MHLFQGEVLDRLPLFDIIHSIDFIEKVAVTRLKPSNAWDLTCRAVAQTLDLVRHFRVPDFAPVREPEDEDRFCYRHQWWTKQVIHIPIQTMAQARDMMKKDTERIHQAIEKNVFCFQALEQVHLFGESFRNREASRLLLRGLPKGWRIPP